MTILSTAIRKLLSKQNIQPTRPSRRLFDIEESPRVSVEQESSLNIRLQKVANGWVVNVVMENSVAHESETHVCSSTDNVIDKVNEIMAIYKLQS